MPSEEVKTQKDWMSLSIATVFTIMMLAATLTTAYSIWQASMYGSQTFGTIAQGINLGSSSSNYLSEALMQKSVDVDTFVNWVTAVSNKDTQLADFIEERFREEFKPAFYAWRNSTNETGKVPPGTPFDRPEYKNANLEKSQQINLEIAALNEKASENSKYSSRLVLVTVLTAPVVFLASTGESKIKRSKAMKILILVVALALLLVGWSIVLSIPPIWSY